MSQNPPQTSPDLVPHVDEAFNRFHAAFGASPHFDAAAGPFRSLLEKLAGNGMNLISNPTQLKLILSVASVAFPAAAPYLAQIGPLLADLKPVIAVIQGGAAPASGPASQNSPTGVTVKSDPQP